MALHTGAVELRDGDYFGPALNRVARLLAERHGGQMLLSQTTCEPGPRHACPTRCRLRDLGAHRLKDLARPEQVFQLSAPGLPQRLSAAQSLSTHPNNLPQQVTSFIGREKEIAEVEALLAKTRLLTLTGSGGCGKTRSGLQVAADSLEQFPDGVWLVELAPLADPGLVPQTVATVLGVKEEPGKPITETLAEHLKDKRLLLVLDNCEHLLDACAQLADALLRQCPRRHDPGDAAAKRSASRASRRTACRRCRCRIAKQAHDAADSVAHSRRCSSSSTARCWCARISQVTNQNAPALASLCHRLDGIPLAIELAAARVRSLSVEEIDGKLDERFRLLTGGSRTALPRQQTLRSLIDWSYDLLHEPEQAAVAAAVGVRRRLDAGGGGAGLRRRRRGGRRSARSADLALPTRAWWWRSRATDTRATGCWRRCGSTRGRGCWRAGAARRCGNGIGTTSWRWRRRRSRN